MWGDATAARRRRPKSSKCALGHPETQPRSARPCDPSLACMLSLRRVICSSKDCHVLNVPDLPVRELAARRLNKLSVGLSSSAQRRALRGHFNRSCRRPGVKLASEQGLKNGVGFRACRSRLNSTRESRYCLAEAVPVAARQRRGTVASSSLEHRSSLPGCGINARP